MRIELRIRAVRTASSPTTAGEEATCRSRAAWPLGPCSVCSSGRSSDGGVGLASVLEPVVGVLLRVEGLFGGGAGHHEAQDVAGGVGRDGADDPSAVHDGDPVGQGVDLVELGGDDEDGGAGVALGDDALVDELDGAHVQAAGGLGGDEDLEGPGELAGEDGLLLVASREGGDGVVDVGDAHVELLAHPVGGVAHARRGQ